MTGTRTLDGREVPVAGRWVFDPDHTVMGFLARHMVFTKVRGRCNEFTGSITIGERLEDSTVEATIDAASISTAVDARDEHLRSADFLDVENHPYITFRSTGVDLAGSKLTGDLTVRDITRPVTLAFTYEGTADYPWGGSRTMFTANTELTRKDWDMTWNVPLETGGLLVSEKVTLELEVQAILEEE